MEFKTTSILDLPEPIRSKSLADMGMTADEFAAHMAACDLIYAEKDAAVAAGLVKPSTWQTDEAGSAQPIVVED